MSQKFYFAAVALLCGFFCVRWCGAEENPLRVSMLCENKVIAPGETFWVGFDLDHPPGYHSYWKHPGHIGWATQISWQLPEAVQAGPIHWPTPESVMMSVHRAQGYQGHVMLMVPITTPREWSESTLTLRAKLNWMCCGEGCHPAHQVPFSLTIPVASQAQLDERYAKRFASARLLLPRVDQRWKTVARQLGEKVILELRPAKSHLAEIPAETHLWFFCEQGFIDSTKEQHWHRRADGVCELHMCRHPMAPQKWDSLKGVLRSSAGWDRQPSSKGLLIDAKVRQE